jgi:hypothetical protein
MSDSHEKSMEIVSFSSQFAQIEGKTGKQKRSRRDENDEMQFSFQREQINISFQRLIR